MLEASNYERLGVGETLPPPTRAFLERLGVWDAFSHQQHRKVYGTTALWGADLPLDNHFIYMPGNTGWLLDRSSFDAMLANQAETRGAFVMRDTRVLTNQKTDDAWRLNLSTGATVTARFVVDATGSAAHSPHAAALALLMSIDWLAWPDFLTTTTTVRAFWLRPSKTAGGIRAVCPMAGAS